MPAVSALFRYPVKGFTPEPRKELRVQRGGRIDGDRALAFRFASATRPEARDGRDYWPKNAGLSLMRFPSLAQLTLRLDDDIVVIDSPAGILVRASLDPAGRRRIADAVAAWLRDGPDGALLDAEGALPLELLGDGRTPRFQDRPEGFVSLHAAASVEAVDAAVDAPVDDRRFRSNVVVAGIPAWSELGWTGRVRIGEVRFEVQKPIQRCAAIMANPDTGERDARLLRVLTSRFGQDEPTLGILLLPADGGGTIRVGDEVVLEPSKG
ncbi:MOSC domain-containing protein [Microbacterium sp. SORGH_AS_0888]|uniref:MOSC domain-containing protein n=1 Tax=Microbacterium sp. SORGH_AS_0888 TaxID=3041791 RepID=UPI0027875B84|nr:MOSC domain-containing protein [Microbacterium sp. SORGH_AS_0888]MDQ1128604.1 uncharacterized protein YcbX [Microbacterium sp. SORGH_AS_0888]